MEMDMDHQNGKIKAKPASLHRIQVSSNMNDHGEFLTFEDWKMVSFQKLGAVQQVQTVAFCLAEVLAPHTQVSRKKEGRSAPHLQDLL